MLNPTRPYAYLLAYVVLLYVRPHEFVPVFMGWPVLPVFLLVSFFSWLFWQSKNLSAPQFRLIPVLTIAMAISVAVNGWLAGGLNVIVEFLPVVMLFFMVATSIDSMERMREMFIALATCMVAIAWHGIDQSVNGVGWTGAQLSQETRITYLGFLNDPNDLAMAFVMALPMILYLGRDSGFVWKLVSLGGAGAVLYAIYLTNSRGSVIALAAMLLLFGILRFGVVKSFIVLPILIAPLLALGPSRMAEMSADEDSAEGRIEAWYEGVQLFLSHPIFGVGKGSFVDHNGLTAHNSFVLAFAELGLFGYFFWLSNVVISWIMVHRVVQCEPPPNASEETVKQWDQLRALARTLWYGYLGGLVSAFFLSRTYVVILYLHIGLIVALFQLALSINVALMPVLWSERVGRLAGYAVGSVIGMWAVTRALLAFT